MSKHHSTDTAKPQWWRNYRHVQWTHQIWTAAQIHPPTTSSRWRSGYREREKQLWKFTPRHRSSEVRGQRVHTLGKLPVLLHVSAVALRDLSCGFGSEDGAAEGGRKNVYFIQKHKTFLMTVVVTGNQGLRLRWWKEGFQYRRRVKYIFNSMNKINTCLRTCYYRNMFNATHKKPLHFHTKVRRGNQCFYTTNFTHQPWRQTRCNRCNQSTC